MNRATTCQHSTRRTNSSGFYSLSGSVLLIWSITGFALLAATFNFAGLGTTQTSMLIRGAVAGVAALIAAELLMPRQQSRGLLFKLFMIFWAMYLTRIAYDTSGSLTLGRPAYFYWTFSIGACLLPAIALTLRGRRVDWDTLYPWLIGTGGTVLVLAVVSGDTMVESATGGVYDTERLGFESLNPISLGHVAVTVLLAVYWRMRLRKPSMPQRLWSVAAAATGVWVLLATGSRGPLIALILGLLFLEMLKPSRALILLAATAVPLLTLLTIDLEQLDRVFGSTLFTRMEAGLSAADASSSGRLLQIKSAWQIFLNNPVVGGALEDPQFDIWPHNILVEAFMAVGFLGGMLLFAICLMAMMIALRIGRASPAHALAGALYVQYFVAAQLSGSLWGSNVFWTILGYLLAFASRKRPQLSTGDGFTFAPSTANHSAKSRVRSS